MRRSAAASNAIRAEPLSIEPGGHFLGAGRWELNSSGVLSRMEGGSHDR
jgi:hypothetical protein